MRSLTLAFAGIALVVALASCGKQADLDRPGLSPKTRADYAAQKRAQAARVDNETEANSVAEPQNPAIEPYTTTTPTPQAPIPGERVYPSGAPATGP